MPAIGRPDMKEAIRKRAEELGFDAVRFTSAAAPDHAGQLDHWLTEGRHGNMAWIERNAFKRKDPQQVLPGARSVVVLAVNYFRDIPPSEPRDQCGVIARYARYTDYHEVLAGKLKELAGFIDSLKDDNRRSLWYVDTGPILERDLAHRAGIGFTGKHTNLISRSLGNWFFLSEILTTLELEPDPSEHNRCGKCFRCIEACPTDAITSPFQLDARRCISYLTIELKGSIPEEFRKSIGNRIYGCDDCLAVCPWNRFAREATLMREHARTDFDQPDLIALLSLDQQQFKERFRGTPMLRTKRRGVLRNVCVALGNVGDERALPALEKARHDSEPLIAEHAEWAIREIEKRMAARKNG